MVGHWVQLITKQFFESKNCIVNVSGFQLTLDFRKLFGKETIVAAKAIEGVIQIENCSFAVTVESRIAGHRDVDAQEAYVREFDAGHHISQCMDGRVIIACLDFRFYLNHLGSMRARYRFNYVVGMPDSIIRRPVHQ